MAIFGLTWATIVNGERQNAMHASNGRNFILIIESSFMRLMSAIRQTHTIHKSPPKFARINIFSQDAPSRLQPRVSEADIAAQRFFRIRMDREQR